MEDGRGKKVRCCEDGEEDGERKDWASRRYVEARWSKRVALAYCLTTA